MGCLHGCRNIILVFVLGLVAWTGFQCVAYRPIRPIFGDPGPDAFIYFRVRNANAVSLRIAVMSRGLNRNGRVEPGYVLRVDGWLPQLPEWKWQGADYLPARIEAVDDTGQLVYCAEYSGSELKRVGQVEVVVGHLACR